MLTQRPHSSGTKKPRLARVLRLCYRVAKPVAPKIGAGRECTSHGLDREAGESHQEEGHGIRRASRSTALQRASAGQDLDRLALDQFADVAGWVARGGAGGPAGRWRAHPAVAAAGQRGAGPDRPAGQRRPGTEKPARGRLRVRLTAPQGAPSGAASPNGRVQSRPRHPAARPRAARPAPQRGSSPPRAAPPSSAPRTRSSLGIVRTA